MAEKPKSAGEVTLDVVPQLTAGVIGPDTVKLEHVTSDDALYIRYFAAISEGGDLQVIEKDEESFQAFPRRPKGDRVVTDLKSFENELARREPENEGTLWGNAERGEIIAVLNDHIDGRPGWRDDRLLLKLAKDPDWAKWHEISGKYYRQNDFGDIVEDLLHTVVSPDQADLLETIDTIRASTRGEFENTIVRANGAQTVTFNTEVTSTAGRTRQLEVPQFVTLKLRPWEGHATLYDIDAYFRLKIDGSSLALAIKLKPTRQIIRNAWAEVVDSVEQTFTKPVYAAP